MKVMLVSPYFYPKVGGMEGHVLKIAKGLKAKGHKVTVVTTLHDKQLSKETRLFGIKVIRLPIAVTISNSPFSPVWFFKLRKIVKDINPDIVEAHSPVPGLADVAFFARRGKKFVIKYHSGSLKKNKSRLLDLLLGIYEKTILKYIFKKADNIMTVYPQFIESLIGKSNKIVFIPPGVNTSLFKPNINVDKIYDILFVGRVEKTSEWKGIDVLLNAIKELRGERPDIALRLVGSGDAIDDYKKLAKKLKIDDNVSFAGAKMGEDLIIEYNSSKILVLPSKTDSESFGNVLIEAMACGIPVIGSNIGGIPNVIENTKNCILTNPGDHHDLAKAIDALLSKDTIDRKSLVKRANEFSEDKLIIDTEKLLKRTLNPMIIHVTAHYPPHLGGMQKAVQGIAEYTAMTNKYDVKVLTSTIGQRNQKLLSAINNLEVVRLRSVELFNTPIILGLFIMLFRAPKDTIIHLHIAQALTPEITYAVAKIKRLKLIAHLHGDVQASGKAGRLLPTYKKVFLKRVLAGADKVIVPTPSYGTIIQKKYQLVNRPSVIPTGIDNLFFSNHSVSRASNKNFILLYVGRLSVEKNVNKIIDAVALLNINIELNVVGDGPLFDDINRSAINIGTKKNNIKINMVGSKSKNELLEYYKSSDAIIIASNYESQSLVAIEAMASGTPVICADIPGLTDVVKDCGIITKNDKKSLSKAIEYLATNPSLWQFLSSKCMLESRNYSWDNTYFKFEKIYDEIQK